MKWTYFEILVMLEVVNRVHSSSFFNKESVLVDTTIRFLVRLSNLQDVLQSIESDLNDLVIGTLQQVTQRFDTTLRNEVTNLTRFLQSSRSSVRHCPTSFFLRFEIGVLKDVDQRRNDVGIDDRLDLLR